MSACGGGGAWRVHGGSQDGCGSPAAAQQARQSGNKCQRSTTVPAQHHAHASSSQGWCTGCIMHGKSSPSCHTVCMQQQVLASMATQLICGRHPGMPRSFSNQQSCLCLRAAHGQQCTVQHSCYCQQGLISCCPTACPHRLAEVIRDKEEGRHLEELAAGGGKTKKAAKVGHSTAPRNAGTPSG